MDESFTKVKFTVTYREGQTLHAVTDRHTNLTITQKSTFQSDPSKVILKLKEQGKAFGITITARLRVNDGKVKIHGDHIYLKTSVEDDLKCDNV